MAKQTIGQKAERVLKLLLGLRNARVAAALTAHGFTEKDLREGWTRLGDLTRKRLGTRVPVKDPRMIQELDEFENTWFRIAHAVLDQRLPDVASTLFLNLTQTTGDGVVISVGTFLERLADMEKGQNGFGQNAAAALQLLRDRGLSSELVTSAQKLVDALGTIVEDPAVATSLAEQQTAEDALWAWYLEWSGIARVAIRDNRLLRTLGFLQGKRAVVNDPGVESPAQTPLPPVSGASAMPPPVVVLAPNPGVPAPSVAATPPPGAVSAVPPGEVAAHA